MSKKANPTMIGAFVVGAVLLGVTATLLFGGGALFRRMHPFVIYFQGDVNGLTVGSPVKFQGVQVGSVQSIRLRITPEGATTIVPVTIGLDETLIERRSGIDATFENGVIQRSIDQGLRARLETQSFVTGQRYVALVLEPDSPANLLGLSEDLEEIPALPTTIEEISRVLEQFPVQDMRELIQRMSEATAAVRDLVVLQETQELPASFAKTLAGIDELVAALHAQVGPFGARIEDASAVIQDVAQEVELTLETLRVAAERTQEVEAEMSQTLTALRSVLAPEAPLVVQLQATLQEFAGAARALRSLAELLERDPGALLRGKDFP